MTHTRRELLRATAGLTAFPFMRSALAAAVGRQELALREGADLGVVDLGALQGLLDASLAALESKVMPPPPAAPDAAGDPLETLRRLRQLLVERNMRSVSVCEELTGQQTGALGAEFAALATAVGRLDFAKALKACDLLLDRLNPR